MIYESTGQTQEVHPVFKSLYTKGDSLIKLPKSPWIAGGEVVLQNLLVGAFNRYVTQADYSHISLKTIGDNFRTGFVWDNDSYLVNQLGHPYQGGMYFNAARANGMSFWGATPYTVGGSLMWEFFMENEPPSLNDLFSTTFGGIALGEITFRLSDLVLDSRATGRERVVREILAGLLSPGRALNRLLHRRAWEVTPYRQRLFSQTPSMIYLSTGARALRVEQKSDVKDESKVRGELQFDFAYGDILDDSGSAPYGWFSLSMAVSGIPTTPSLDRINIIASLYRNTIYSKGRHTLLWGAFQHFDYYNSTQGFLSGYGQVKAGTDVPYRVSESAVAGAALLYKMAPNARDRWAWDLRWYANIIFMGASLSDNYHVDNRDYNLGSGLSTKLHSILRINKRWSIISTGETYHLFTWAGRLPLDARVNDRFADYRSAGAANYTNLNLGRFAILYHPNRWLFKLESDYIRRSTKYRDYEDVTFDVAGSSLTIGYRL